MLTIYGLVAVSIMLFAYALERRGRHYVALFALGCLAASVYGFLAGTWPFGVVEIVWAALAWRRYRQWRE